MALASMLLGVGAAALCQPARSAAQKPPAAARGETAGAPASLVLVTLDTTRADHLGCYGAAGAATPNLDALAARGTRWARALAPAPLTLPAHASLLTGLEPPEHGLTDNGVAALGDGVPTLAGALAARGWATGAFVASRVLDRRFGLARGFDVYDERMAAERVGEYGYPERDAAAVTDAALEWARGLPAGRGYFLWVHYYDPHAPYQPPPELRGAGGPGASPDERAYAGEIAYVDRELGRLLAGLPGDPARRLVAAVGDHGEMLGEHGERAHGIFLYRAALEVPLILAGPRVPAGQVVTETVGTVRLAPTLAALAGAGGALAGDAPALPGLPALGERPAPRAVVSITDMPASAFGWSGLEAISDQRYRLIVAPRPELYDYLADPGETANLLDSKRPEAQRLKRELEAARRGFDRHPAATPEADPQLAAQLRSLGYLSGTSKRPGHASARDPIDPKDGIALLDEMDRAKGLMQAGRWRDAAAALAGLVARNPDNVPFLTQLARAQLGAGDGEASIATYRRAIGLNPGLDFLHVNLAAAYRELGRAADARREYELALELNPRAAAAWFNLAEMAHLAGDDAEERRVLLAAVEAGTTSATIHSRLGQIETAAGRVDAGDAQFRAATELAPGWAGPWLLWGQQAEARGELDPAAERYRRAVEAEGSNPAALLRLGRVLLAGGDAAGARPYLERARALGAGSEVGREADRLLGGP